MYLRKVLFLICIVLVVLSGIYVRFKPRSVPISPSPTVKLSPTGFTPSEITVSLNTTITFENVDAIPRWPASNIHPTHSIYPEFDPKAEVAPGAAWQFTFTKAGVWKYHDHLRPEYSGTIHVTGQDNTNRVTIDTTVYNQNVELGAETIFTNDGALGSHLKKFGVTKTITALRLLEPKFGSCHQPAHRAGHIGYALFHDKAFVEYSPECQSGYYHGVMESYFIEHGAENISTSLATLCRGGLNDFFEHQCIHGIGHGLMAWSNYELPEALAACDQLPKRQDSCWTGVFMENLSAKLTQNTANSEPVGNTDIHITKYLKADDPLYPCDWVADAYRNSCYFLQTSRMLQIFGTDFSKISTTCAGVPKVYQLSCFGSMGRDVGGSFPTDNTRQIRACNHVTQSANRIACLDGAVQNSFWDPSGKTQAQTFCKQLPNTEEKAACYKTIIERAGQLFNTPTDKDTFCIELEPTYQTICKRTLLP